jgi:acyl-CoA thioester hydrolase
VELLRAAGHSYRELEEAGIFLVVADVRMQYYLPALFHDVLRLVTETVAAKGARIEHRYQVFRGDNLLAEGATTVACVNREGRVTRLPKWLLEPRPGA